MPEKRLLKEGASPASGPLPAWHSMAMAEVREALAAPSALAAEEVSRRFAVYGSNRLPSVAARSPWARLGRQLRSFLVYVLTTAAIITGALGHWVDAGVILAVVVIQTLVGFIQEGRAEQALSAIRHMLAPKARVVRAEGQRQVDAAELVPGDTVLLEAGDRVPADIRLEKCHNLAIEEAMLTGESVPVDKAVAAVSAKAVLGDQSGMAFAGTMVSTGTGRGVVVGIGLSTEIGRISGLLAQTQSLKTPLLEQIDRFARRLSVIVIGSGIAIFFGGLAFSGLPFRELFMAVVGLTVAAIPEGLPAILTITLAIGVRQMARRHAIVRRMPVIETLGSVSVICSDKTGTLTRNEMMVTRVALADGRYDVTGDGYGLEGSVSSVATGAVATAAPASADLSNAPADGEAAGHPVLQELARAAALCNDAHVRREAGSTRISGDPMEAALTVFAHKVIAEAGALAADWPRKDELPFDTENRFMATLNHDHHGHGVIYLKGAPERILDMCGQQLSAAGPLALNRGHWDQVIAAMASQGLRVLALARKSVAPGATDLVVEDLHQGLQLLGLVGLLDPPRQEAIRAITDCHAAGIRVKMITGDHAITASAIAHKLGLGNPDRVLTGQDLDALDDAGLETAANRVNVFARTSPEHKLRLVAALQSLHGVVAMTGDGVNDAPALKRADVGIAMGIKGSEAAREASSVVLLDDNFASIVEAVREGRAVYTNLKKAIAFILPINGGESVSLIIALLLGLTLPISALQILWVNMVSSVVLAMTLAFEPPEPDIMQHPPRPREQSLLRGFVVWRVALVSLLFLLGIFAAWTWAMGHSGSEAVARTLAVNTLVAMEVFYLFAVRYLDSASLTRRGVIGTPVVLLAVAAVLALQGLFTYVPWLNATFESVPLGPGMIAFAVAAGVLLLLILELETVIRHRYRPDKRQRC